MKKYYAIKNNDNDIRIKSSSGGFFYPISKYVLKNDGVVYGAIYDNDNNIIHERIDDIENIEKLFGSKYSRSNMGSCLQSVQSDLSDGKLVLFSGTPCQIAALKAVLKNNIPDNLILIDVICHGTPQKKFYDDYKNLLEKKYSSKIRIINMRYKKNKKKRMVTGPIAFRYMMVEFKNGRKYIKDARWDLYNRLFDLFLPNGCFSCKYANNERISDITIGDFHDFHDVLKDFNDGNGVSLIIVNSSKGMNYFNRIKDCFNVLEYTYEECEQPALIEPTSKPNNYEEFNSFYDREGPEKAFKKYNKYSFSDKIKYLLYKIKLLDYFTILKKILKKR